MIADFFFLKMFSAHRAAPWWLISEAMGDGALVTEDVPAPKVSRPLTDIRQISKIKIETYIQEVTTMPFTNSASQPWTLHFR